MRYTERDKRVKCFSEEDISQSTPQTDEVFYRLIQFLVEEMTYTPESIRKGFESAITEFKE